MLPPCAPALPPVFSHSSSPAGADAEGEGELRPRGLRDRGERGRGMASARVSSTSRTSLSRLSLAYACCKVSEWAAMLSPMAASPCLAAASFCSSASAFCSSASTSARFSTCRRRTAAAAAAEASAVFVPASSARRLRASCLARTRWVSDARSAAAASAQLSLPLSVGHLLPTLSCHVELGDGAQHGVGEVPVQGGSPGAAGTSAAAPLGAAIVRGVVSHLVEHTDKGVSGGSYGT